MILTGLALVLIVGFCIVGVVTGDTNMGDETPFTVTIKEHIFSFIELLTGPDSTATEESVNENG